MYEEMVWKTLERRIREKVVRSRLGERAGLGVSPGREMLIWASLGSYREAKEKGDREVEGQREQRQAPS